MKFNLELDNCVFCQEEFPVFMCAHCESTCGAGCRPTPATCGSERGWIWNECFNNWLILAKFYIHKCKWLKVKLCIQHWKNELKNLSLALKLNKE